MKELHYYYRAIDNRGRLAASSFSKVRDLQTAESYFKKAVETIGHKPEKVTTDKEVFYPKAINKVLGRTIVHYSLDFNDFSPGLSSHCKNVSDSCLCSIFLK
ncbi:MAG: DDE-type integrase/transposase/recombinase [Chloroflexi bacterium]|nr:DDE-type integrase/transposase/recombinase [Chloroflexota bacterium]